MIKSIDDIELSLRDHFALLFSGNMAFDEKEMREKRGLVLSYLNTYSSAFLTPETLRYQTLIFSSMTVLFVALIFKPASINLLGSPTKVDGTLFAAYTAFLVIVNSIFIVKSFVDYQRFTFNASKDGFVINDYLDCLRKVPIRVQLEWDYWRKICDMIGDCYHTFEKYKAVSKGEESPIKDISARDTLLDFNILSQIPEWKREIARHDTYLSLIQVDLHHDHRLFVDRCEKIMFKKPSTDLLGYTNLDRWFDIDQAYELYLAHWIQARNSLTSVNFKLVLTSHEKDPMLLMSQEVLQVLKRAYRVRKMYLVMEVLLPALASLFITIYIWKYTLLIT